MVRVPPKLARKKVDFNRPEDRKKGNLQDLRVSVCSDCRRGIFTYHKYKWTSNGLVHDPCVVRTDEIKDVA